MVVRVSKRKLSLTLIEVLIVFLILAIGASLIGINMSRAVRQERFHASVQRVLDRLQMAQDIMLLSGDVATRTESRVTFLKDNDGYHCKISFRGHLAREGKPLIDETVALPGIAFVAFRPLDGEEQLDVSLEWRPPVAKLPHGTLILANQPAAGLRRYIPLPGYPVMMTTHTAWPSLPSSEELEDESEQLYPKEVLEKA